MENFFIFHNSFNIVSEGLASRIIIASGERKTLTNLAKMNPIGTKNGTCDRWRI